MVSGRAPPVLPMTAMPCAMASSAARGVASTQRGVLREGTTTHVEPGPDLVDRGAGERAEPGDASGDAQPLGEPLELLLGGPGARPR